MPNSILRPLLSRGASGQERDLRRCSSSIQQSAFSHTTGQCLHDQNNDNKPQAQYRPFYIWYQHERPSCHYAQFKSWSSFVSLGALTAVHFFCHSATSPITVGQFNPNFRAVQWFLWSEAQIRALGLYMHCARHFVRKSISVGRPHCYRGFLYTVIRYKKAIQWTLWRGSDMTLLLHWYFHAFTLFHRPMQKVSYWTVSSLPVLLWYFFFCLFMRVLVIDRQL